ncbi:potassium channel subfamily K member 1-like isoform X1 [Daphnia pulex]|uniref:potassium channel subfamily K member 1-like isoform X1 n=1 Tax=Daphnia pulex TaxID=6669 RepID=UPI001EDDCC82|nr:potassium channel subfamily K member 1-like isoform X1 [Daphnia pulex]XP_046653768.1 potassium channel subfamily K member 1-like isoform X1 [Daphnia pulicaria]
MVQLHPSEITMAHNVAQRRSDDRLPLLSNNGRFRESPLRHLWLGLQRSSWFLIAFLAVFITYLSLGALVFSSMEQPLNRQYRLDIRNRVEKFLFKYPLIPEQELDALLMDVVQATNRGVAVTRNVSSEPNWSFGQSFFFAGTVVTTIGYGHVTPLSEGGKIFCIVYALIGIPMTLMLLTALVDRLMVPSTWLLRYLNAKLGHLYQPFNIRVFHLLVIATVLVVFFFLVPAGVFNVLEPDWNYLDSIYYCFISLTTIGLGDYIPGDSPNQPLRPLYKIGTTVYLLIGLVFMVLTLTVFYEIPQLNVGSVFLLKSDEYLANASTYDSEKARIQGGPSLGGVMPSSLGSSTTSAVPFGSYGAGYGATEEESGRPSRQIVRVKSRREEDSPSPEDTTPVHARP